MLRHPYTPKPNLKKEEQKALQQLKSHRSHVILTADEGMALFVMDRHEYIKKAKILLVDPNTYKPIPTDLNNKHKAKLINILKEIKTEMGMDETACNRNSTGASSPKYYGLPKIRKDIPLRPIVSSRGSVTYWVAKELARIHKPLVGKSIHHVSNKTQFAKQLRNTKLEEVECITTYNVTDVTAVPVACAKDIIQYGLKQDTELPSQTIMSANNIIELMGFCLNNTYFLFQGHFYKQTKKKQNKSCYGVTC